MSGLICEATRRLQAMLSGGQGMGMGADALNEGK